MAENLCRETLESCRSQALEIACARIAEATEDTTPAQRAAALHLYGLILDWHAERPMTPFPLLREALGTWPTKTYKPRATLPKRPTPEDPYKGNRRVAEIRAKVGLSLAMVQHALRILRQTGLLESHKVTPNGRVRGRGAKRAPIAWVFGTEIAATLRKAFFRFLKSENQNLRDQEVGLGLTDFWLRALGRKLAATVMVVKVQGELAIEAVVSAVTQTARALDFRAMSPDWAPAALTEKQQAEQQLAALRARPLRLATPRYVR